MSPNPRQDLLELIAGLAYQEGEFLLSSGVKSSYYINCKTVTLHPQGAYLVGHLCGALLSPDTVAVGGLTLGADPMVTAISLVSATTPQPVSGLIIRKEPKGHGARSQIEGPLPPAGSQVTAVEDVVTTGAILGISGAGATGGGLSGVRRNYPGGSLARGAGVLGGNGGAFNGLIYPS